MKSITLTIGLFVLLPVIAQAETHAEVQAALDYQLPANTCGKPIAVSGDSSSAPPPTQSSGSVAVFEGTSSASVSDVDGYSRKRLERKEKRRKKCVASYKDGLLGDMETLKDSAKHGLTEGQAKAILGSMALIQKVYMTQNGVLEADQNQ
ncbi:MAG: hypothetical protein GKR90_17780 [Pseudomonadales bacterium]|nr:hypothetical protein [Pseudomonadales bacterium]